MKLALIYVVAAVAVLVAWRQAHRVPSDLDERYRSGVDAMRQIYGACDARCPACGGWCSQSPYHRCIECNAQVCAREWP